MPSVLYWWPMALLGWIRWRFEHKDEIAAEKARVAKEAAEEEEQARIDEEEEERDQAAKEKKKTEGAKRLAERQKAETEKKEKWAEEARLEAEREAEKEAGRSLIVEGRVAEVNEMKKKGHLLIEVVYDADGEEERASIVIIDRQVPEGARVKIALEGAVVPGRSDPVKRQKLAGEWSEGELLEILAAKAEDSAAPAKVPEDSPGGVVEDEEEAEGKPRERKKKTKG